MATTRRPGWLHRRTRVGIAIGVATALILGSCAPPDDDPDDPDAADDDVAVADPDVDEDATLVIAIPGTPPGIDPDFHSSPQAWTIGAQLYGNYGSQYNQVPYEPIAPHPADPNAVNGFWVADSDLGAVTPGIIESCQIEPDGAKVTLELREGVLSPYGNEFTTADIEWSLDRSFDTGAIGNFFALVAGAPERDQWQAIDDYTMEVTQRDRSLANLCPLLTHIGFVGPLFMDSTETQRHATDEDPWATEWVSEMGSWFGPYYVTEWVSDERVVLEANPNWWGEELAIQRIIYQVIPESSARISLLRAGEVDLIEGITPEEAIALDGEPGVHPIAVESNRQFFVVMDNTVPPFDDVQVRTALSHALDRRAIVESVYRGLAFEYQGMLPVTFAGFEPFDEHDFDLDRARELLAEAGYPDGFSAELSISTVIPEEEEVAIIWQSALAEIGVDIEIRKLTTAAISDLVFQQNAEFAMWQDAPHLPDPVFGMQLWYDSRSTGEFNKFHDDEFNAKVDECAMITDFDERTSCAQEAATLAYDHYPAINVTAPHFLYAVSDRVSGANFFFSLAYLVMTMELDQ